jgi:hypothetical protein
MARDYILDDDGDLKIEAGDFVFGDAETDDVLLILGINQGELKSDPLCGTNMTQRIRSQQTPEEIQRAVRLQMQRDGKNFNEIKAFLKTIINGD